MNRSRHPVGLAISGKHHQELRRHLFPGDGNEAVAFAICGRASRPDGEMLLVHEIVEIPHHVCERTPHHVTWPGEALDEALTHAMNSGMALVKFHSHPTGYPWFSETDDRAENLLFPSVYGWLGNQGPMASVIMLPDGRLVGRAVHEWGIGQPLKKIRVAGDDFFFWQEDDHVQVPEFAKRVAQTFGEGTFAKLRNLKIGVVGCSGTGSIVAEQLARNGVGELILVDPDHVEGKNLNRILNSTAKDVEGKRNKTFVLRRAIEEMEMGTIVSAHPYDLCDGRVLLDLSACDIVFGCMDSIDGRHVLNKLAATYLIPYIDVGVRLDADGAGNINSIWLAIHTLQPGGSSLKSRGVYDQAGLDAAFLLRTSPDEYSRLKKQGYIKGIDIESPAVISVNMQAASIAVNEFLARIHIYKHQANSEFAAKRVALHDDEASFNQRDGEPCKALERVVGLGDQRPFLGMPLLGVLA